MSPVTDPRISAAGIDMAVAQPCYPGSGGARPRAGAARSWRGIRLGAQHRRCRIGRRSLRRALLSVEPDAAVGPAVRAGARARAAPLPDPDAALPAGPGPGEERSGRGHAPDWASRGAPAIAPWMRPSPSSARFRRSCSRPARRALDDARSDRRAGAGACRPRLQHLRPRRELRHPAQAAPPLRRQRHPARFPGDRTRARDVRTTCSGFRAARSSRRPASPPTGPICTWCTSPTSSAGPIRTSSTSPARPPARRC